jgi:hypothetical protein
VLSPVFAPLSAVPAFAPLSAVPAVALLSEAELSLAELLSVLLLEQPARATTIAAAIIDVKIFFIIILPPE